jgi:uncharacterized membrane protein
MDINILKDKVFTRLLIIAFISYTLSFIIKVLAVKGIIPWNIGYSDTACYFFEVNHKIPYFTFDMGYPVIIGALVYLASRFNLAFYLTFHYIVFLFCLVVSTFYLYKLSIKMKTPSKYLFIFWAFSISFFLFSFFNWDIIAVMFSLMALYYYKEQKDVLATIFAGLGFATKIYPILFLFPVLLNKKFLDWLKIGIIFVLTYLVTNIYFIIRSFSGWYYFYQANNLREPNPDSIWGIIYRLFPKFSISSINLTTLILLASSYFILCILFRKKDFILLSFAATILFILFNKVFSPQYILWILPFLALYGSNIILFRALEFTNLIVLICICTYLLISANIELLALMDIFVYLREIAIIWMLVMLINQIAKSKNIEYKENLISI